MKKRAKGTPILNGAYEVLHVVPGPIGYKTGTVDLSRITAAQAEKLVAQGFPYLRKAEKPPKPPKPPKEQDEDKG